MDSDRTINISQGANDSAPKSHAPIEVGQVLDGKYEVLSLLGKGGMGTVYRVKQKLLGVDLALKTLDAEQLSDSAAARRFQTEAKAAFSLKHPNLVKVHDFGVFENGQPFFAMDLVEGQTLQDMIKQKGRLSLEQIEAIFTQICFGLAFAHSKSVVHRDVKPGNIMVTGGDLRTEGSVKILDFGIAKVVAADRGEMDALTRTGEIFGSPLYMSPEQCSGLAIDHRTDVYSLGCVLFEALTGTPPLIGTNPLRTMMMHVNDEPPSLKEAAMGVEFPPQIERVVSKMLSKAASDRYSDLSIAAHEISAACLPERRLSESSMLSTSSQTGLTQSEIRRVSFSPWQFFALLASVAIVSSMLTALLVLQFPKESSRKQDADHEDSKKLPTINMYHDNVNDPIDPEQLTAEPAAYKAEYQRIPRIFQTIINTGKPEKAIQFPNRLMGQVRYRKFDGRKYTDEVTADAIGRKIFPINAALAYYASSNLPYLFKNSFIFEKIGTEIFTGVIIDGSTTGHFVNALINEADPDEKLDSRVIQKGIVHLLTVIKSWTNLKNIMFCNLTLKNEYLQPLNNLSNLNTLTLNSITFDSNTLARQSFIPRLHNLFVANGDLDPLLKAFSKGSLKLLDIGDKCIFTSGALKLLSSCESLVTIIFRARVDDATARTVSSLTNISVVAFDKPLTASQAAYFKSAWKPLNRDKFTMVLSKKGDIFISRGHEK